MSVLEHTGTRALHVDAGEVVAVLGAPGTGKSRLALELAFLARPENGEVLLHGTNPVAKRRRFEPAHRPREVTLLVQNAEDQLFARTVFDDVAFGPRHLVLSDEEIERRVVSALQSARLDPTDVRFRSPFALSGGERRRVALAGVLAMEPEVLVLDEPTANLDPKTRNEFLDLLAPLRHKSAIVWLTGRAREASLADRVYLLTAGRTEEVPAGADLLTRWRDLLDAGVELPSVYELAGALEQRGVDLPAVATASELEEAIAGQWRKRNHAG